jgi:hypothetical protein
MELTIPVKVTDRTFERLTEIAGDGGPKALRVAVLGGG